MYMIMFLHQFLVWEGSMSALYLPHRISLMSQYMQGLHVSFTSTSSDQSYVPVYPGPLCQLYIYLIGSVLCPSICRASMSALHPLIRSVLCPSISRASMSALHLPHQISLMSQYMQGLYVSFTSTSSDQSYVPVYAGPLCQLYIYLIRSVLCPSICRASMSALHLHHQISLMSQYIQGLYVSFTSTSSDQSYVPVYAGPLCQLYIYLIRSVLCPSTSRASMSALHLPHQISLMSQYIQGLYVSFISTSSGARFT